MRGFDATDEPLAPETGIVDDDHARLDALGDVAGGPATAPRQLGQLGAQIRMHPIEKPRGDVAPPFVRREAEAIVAGDPDVHPSANERPVAVGPSYGEALLLGNHGVEQTASGLGQEAPPA